MLCHIDGLPCILLTDKLSLMSLINFGQEQFVIAVHNDKLKKNGKK